MPDGKPNDPQEEFNRELYRQLNEVINNQIAQPERQAELMAAANAAAARVVQNAIAEFASRGAPPLMRDMHFTSGDMLTHARSLFEYHAGQRLNSIRYYIVAYSLFATGYFTVLKSGISSGFDHLQIFLISLVTFIVSACFWLLDRRNHELVRIDEIALEELEKYAASNHESVGNTFEHRHVEHSFTITKNSNDGILRFHDWVQYKIIFRTLFFILTVLSLGALSISTNIYISFCDSKGSSIISKSCYESSSKGTEGSGQGSSAEKGTDTGSSADKGTDTGSTGKPRTSN